MLKEWMRVFGLVRCRAVEVAGPVHKWKPKKNMGGSDKNGLERKKNGLEMVLFRNQFLKADQQQHVKRILNWIWWFEWSFSFYFFTKNKYNFLLIFLLIIKCSARFTLPLRSPDVRLALRIHRIILTSLLSMQHMSLTFTNLKLGCFQHKKTITNCLHFS